MSLLTKLEDCYRPLLEVDDTPFTFHSIKRLREQEEVLRKISKSEQVTDAEKRSLELALGLHFAAQWENNRAPAEGLNMALDRLNASLDKNEQSRLQEAASLVTAAHAPEPHNSSIVLILRDALTSYYAHPKFEKRLEALRQEIKRMGGKDIEGDIWYRSISRQMRHHRYATASARAKFDQKKSENLSNFKKMLKRRARQVDETVAQVMQVDEAEVNKLKKKLTKVQGVPERGIETWYRLASKNLYTRRQIVDTKSSILLTVNSIILSIALGSLYPRLQDDWHLTFALTPLVLTNLLSIAFAIFATRPRLNKGVFSNEEVENKSARLMTFDDFFQMSESEFEWAVEQVTQDRTSLYGTIKRDMYRLGVDLSRRYKNIQIGYNIFLIGIIFSVFMFGICHIMF